ncbi:F11 receptor, tandem duplicate 1 isoform X1 [Xiphophorus couchianus]|uniref:F11 receptor, tandem duplicate 1 isoform X1 n=1 Tax=Xiphophorus couchianus TaxID=32473 RepID=UPI001015FFE0|nr:junctional adhesion molecule A-like isoform X1 [Xiphophorus couchianus]
MGRLVSLLLFMCAATGGSSFDVTTSPPTLRVKENEGVDMSCSYTADFGADVRMEWRFVNSKGSTHYVLFDKKITEPYANRVNIFSSTNLRFSKVTRQDNGEYFCDVSSSSSPTKNSKVALTVLVPPSVPKCGIPQTVTTNAYVALTCHDPDSSPPPTYNWYKGTTLLPADPSKNVAFKNATYKLDSKTGMLVFPSVTKMDTGEYYCEVSNDAGPSQSCKSVKMEVRDINTGGIVAGVIFGLLFLGLLIGGLWYANKKGYLPLKSESNKQQNAAYQPPSMYAGGGGEEDNGEFKQKSSFVV